MIKNIYYLKLMFILLNIVQQQKLMKKVILIETLFLNKKDERHQKKNLTVNLLELILVENFDADYEASEIQTYISQYKDDKIKEKDNKIKERDNKIKERDNKIKERDDKIKKLELQLANLNVKNNDDNDKK